MSESLPTIPRLDYLDALRGFAALYVVVYHISLMPKPALNLPEWARSFVNYGGSGVTLFFIISGFSMCLSWKRHAAAASPVKSFYINRLARIAPLFYFWLILSIARDAAFKGAAGHHGAVEVGANALFLFNLYEPFQFGIVWASWTIGVEMLFYALFPFIKRAGFDTLAKTSLLLVLSMAVIALTRGFVEDTGHLAQPFARTWFDNVGFFFVLPIFLMGVVTYHLHELLLPKLAASGQWPTMLLLGTALLTLGLLVVYRPPGAFWYYVAAAGYALLLLGCAAWSRTRAIGRWASYLGRISYSLYLNHPSLVYALIPAYLFIYKIAPEPNSAFFSCVALTWAILIPLSHLTFRFIESPLMKLGKPRRIGQLASKTR